MPRTKEMERLHTWATRLREHNASLTGLLEAFEPLFIEMLRVQTALAAAGVPEAQPDMDKLSRGIPQFVDADLGGYAQGFLASARKMLPVMAQSFPGVSEDLRKVMYGLESDAMDPRPLMEAVIRGDEAHLAGAAKALGVGPACLHLAATLTLRPVLRTVGREVEAAAGLGTWGKGYCPVCGALPALAILRRSGEDGAYLKSHGGQRWLHCSRCASSWRFKRHACPHCGNEEHDSLEYFQAQGGANERADLCRECGRYLVTYDASGALEEPTPDMAALGLLPMDIVMQRDGYSPVAETAWNKVDL